MTIETCVFWAATREGSRSGSGKGEGGRGKGEGGRGKGEGVRGKG
jgi:hypothetical protein